MKKIKILLSSFTLIASLAIGIIVTPAADVFAASITDKGCEKVGGVFTAATTGDNAKPARCDCSRSTKPTECGAYVAGGGDDRDLNDVIKTVINTVLFVVGILSVVMLIYGGIKYTLSAGDASKVTAAKNTIMYSIVGLIVALLAFAIVNFVIGALAN